MSDLKLLTTGELKKILKEASRAEYDKINPSTSQEQLIAIIKMLFKEIDNRTFIKLRKLGVPGKDGIVWAVKYKPPEEKRNPGVYALKQFKPSKSSKKILLESELQSGAAQNGISPKIIDTDIFGKFIVMDLLSWRSIAPQLRGRRRWEIEGYRFRICPQNEGGRKSSKPEVYVVRIYSQNERDGGRYQ